MTWFEVRAKCSPFCVMQRIVLGQKCDVSEQDRENTFILFELKGKNKGVFMSLES